MRGDTGRPVGAEGSAASRACARNCGRSSVVGANAVDKPLEHFGFLERVREFHAGGGPQ